MNNLKIFIIRKTLMMQLITKHFEVAFKKDKQVKFSVLIKYLS